MGQRRDPGLQVSLELCDEQERGGFLSLLQVTRRAHSHVPEYLGRRCRSPVCNLTL